MDDGLKSSIGRYFRQHYRQLGEGKSIRVLRVYYLGRGTRHKNFVVRTSARKYIVRMSFTTKVPYQRARHVARNCADHTSRTTVAEYLLLVFCTLRSYFEMPFTSNFDSSALCGLVITLQVKE